MRTLQELLDSVAADLDSSINYTAQLCSGGYRTPNSVKQADNAEQIQRACGLLLGDANIIWKAAGGFAGKQLKLVGCDDTNVTAAGQQSHVPSRQMLIMYVLTCRTPCHLCCSLGDTAFKK